MQIDRLSVVKTLSNSSSEGPRASTDGDAQNIHNMTKRIFNFGKDLVQDYRWPQELRLAAATQRSGSLLTEMIQPRPNLKTLPPGTFRLPEIN